MRVPRINSGVIFRGEFRIVEGLEGEYRQDSEAVGESFWDGQGVEMEARPFLSFRPHDMS